MDSNALTYQNGQHLKTRGDWNDREKTTGNVRDNSALPLQPWNIEVRGEWLYEETSRSIKPSREEEDSKLSHPRNAAAGSSSADPKVAKRNLSVFSYSSPSVEELKWLQHKKMPEMAEIWLPTTRTLKNAKRLVKYGIIMRRLKLLNVQTIRTRHAW